MKAYKTIKECVISYYSDTILTEFCSYTGDTIFIDFVGCSGKRKTSIYRLILEND